MVLSVSNSQVGNKAPVFDLFKEDHVNLIMFICNHCPYVEFRMSTISKLVKDYKDRVNIVAINSNDSTDYPEDAPEYMSDFAKKWDLQCQYIYDYNQAIAHNYNAVCTPEFYVVNKEGIISYHGELDPAHTSNNLEPTGSTLRHALDLALVDRYVHWLPNPSFGCSIKWKE